MSTNFGCPKLECWLESSELVIIEYKPSRSHNSNNSSEHYTDIKAYSSPNLLQKPVSVERRM